MLVLAIDPGRNKAGIALVSEEEVIEKNVIKLEAVISAIHGISSKFEVDAVIVGDGTGSRRLAGEIKRQLNVEVTEVDEKGTSRLAKERYLRENKRSLFDHMIPIGLRTPKEPYDDYVAVILAERYIAKHNSAYNKSKS